MEKDIGKIQKNDSTDIVVRVDDFGGRVGVTIREFVTGADGGYSGFTKAGTRIPAGKFEEFKALINAINPDDLKMPESENSGEASKPSEETSAESTEQPTEQETI